MSSRKVADQPSFLGPMPHISAIHDVEKPPSSQVNDVSSGTFSHGPMAFRIIPTGLSVEVADFENVCMCLLT